MARPLRIEYPGALYHVTARGNAQQDIFLDDEDRQRFLGVLDRVVSRFHLSKWGSRLNTVSLTGSLPANTISVLTAGAVVPALDGTPDAD